MTVMPASAAFPLARTSAALPLARPESAAATATPGKSEAETAELRKAAQSFEAIFLRQMIGAMRSATDGDTLLGSTATDQFRDLMDARVAEDMAGRQSLGIADMVLKQFGIDKP